MLKLRPLSLSFAFATTVLIAGCQASSPTAEADPVAPPMDAVGEFDSRWSYMIDKYDANTDGQITAEEYDRGATQFVMVDRNEDGVLTEADFGRARPTRGGTRHERPEPPSQGDIAPDFTLVPHDGGEAITLSDYVGDRPVALIFGSYT